MHFIKLPGGGHGGKGGLTEEPKQISSEHMLCTPLSLFSVNIYVAYLFMDKYGFTITIAPLERGLARDTGSMLRTSSSAEDSLPTGRPRLSKKL